MVAEGMHYFIDSMRLLGGGLGALLLGQFCQGQVLPVVTKTVYRSCATTTTFTFPSLGWVSSGSSSLPYTFTPSPLSSRGDVTLSPGISSPGVPSPATSQGASPIFDSTSELSTGYPTGPSISDGPTLSAPSSAETLPSATQSTEVACASASVRPISCPASNGTLYFPPGSCAGISGNDNSYLIFCGRNYEGTASPTLSDIPSEEACIAACTADAECVGVGYNILSQMCVKSSDIRLDSISSVPGIIFAVQRRYYVSMELEQPAETVPPVVISTSLISTSMDATVSQGGTLPTAAPIGSSNAQQNPSITTSSEPTESPIPTAPTAPGTYVYGGTAVRAVIGGTTQTFTSGGQLSTAVTGGLTTTYTSGGVTTTIPGPVPEATSNSVEDAVIGACPAYDSRSYEGPESDGTTYLVACGEIYNGTISGRESLLKRAVGVECISRCEAMEDCAALSYTSGECIFFSEVNGQTDSDDPTFSAVRLDSNEDVGEEVDSSSSASQSVTITTLVSTSTSLLEVPATTTTSTILESSFTVTLTTTARGETTTILSVSTRDASTAVIVLPASTTTVLLTTSVPVTVTATPLASNVVSTVTETPPTLTEQITITTTVTSLIPGSTVVSTNLITTTIGNGVVSTSTERITSTLPASTLTIVQVETTTAPNSIIVSTLISVPPPFTQTQRITVTGSTYNVTQTVTSLIPGSTVISTSLLTTTIGDGIVVTSTQQVTSTLPASTVTSLQIQTTTAPGSIIVSTYVPTPVVSTQFETRTIISTRPAQVVTSYLPGSIVVSTQTTTLPASTRTISYETTIRETGTALVTTTEAGRTVVQTITSALPASTSTVISVSTVSGSTITNFVTRTEAVVTVVSTKQAATIISTIVSTAAASTILQPTTVISTRDVVMTAAGSTVIIVSTTTSVIPASTLTQTIRTTLAAETVVMTNSVPGQTTTLAFTTTRAGSTITTTSLSIQPASTATFTTSVVSYISYGRVACPADNGQMYTGADGSLYMILCGADYSGTSGDGSSANIYGINPVAARDLGACVNACTSQGTACVGVSWQSSTRRCDLKRTMFPTDETLTTGGFDSVVRVFAGTEPSAVIGTSQLSNGDFSTGALSPWTVAFQEGASVAASNNSAAISFTGDSGYLNLRQTLQSPVSASAGNAYYMTFSIGTSGLTQDGALAVVNLGSYGLGLLNYPVNQPQTKVHLSGRLDSVDITTLTLIAQSQSSAAGGILTIDDISLITYPQKPGINPIPIPPVVANATYTFNDITITEYIIPQLEFRQTFTLNANARITLADSSTTCWLAMSFYPFQQRVVYQTFVTNGTVAISASGYLFAVTTSFDVEFLCRGVSGSALTISSFFLRAF
ncbi:uncharacterized protein RCC_12119 [Ramularia collo-cygni]|uniref:Apple domain-containing protein n=1 Tax=Ramularia collo-cygni TaxID=112498 RepID=A0A2D3V0K0_9PEZI|nr:uncharacterized protein RCC_12119 [Ramularia collo-cygni]CZT15029.1 uncharacterized protein RCC_12119 [Ramularia collo-cygni]